MPTLSSVKLELTTVLKWAAIVFGILLALFLLIKFVFFVKNTISPTPTAPAKAGFGKIPAQYLPSGIKRTFSYSIDTVSGDLPTFADRENVYKLVLTTPQLLNYKNASKKITSLGFDGNSEKLSDSVYRWRESGTFNKVLVLDINHLQFDLSSNFLEDPNVTTANNLPTKEEAVTQAKDFLSSLGAFPSDIDERKTKAKLLKVNNGLISDASNASNANLVTVYFFQKDLNQLPIFYPGGKISSMNVTISGGGGAGQVVDARFFYQQISQESSTYPIKTVKQAYDELKSSKAYIASADQGVTNIKIKKVYLAYFSPGKTQYFIAPVMVFEGTNNFIGIVPAVKDEWLSK